MQYRTPEGRHRGTVVGRDGLMTPEQARQAAGEIPSAVAEGVDPAAPDQGRLAGRDGFSGGGAGRSKPRRSPSIAAGSKREPYRVAGVVGRVKLRYYVINPVPSPR